MRKDFIQLTQTDGHVIKIQHYISNEQTKGNFLLLHGMAEHYERYDSFASFLTSHGFDVYLYSHRGHGTDLPESELGFFGPENGYRLVIEDAISILTEIRRISPNLPLFLMGHSMGSIITRNVIQEYQDLDGVILCATANPHTYVTYAGLVLATLTGYKKTPQKKSPFLDQTMFGTSLYKKLNKRTKVDWLCTDEAQVDQYIKDPYCGFVCSKSFYHDLLMLTLHATMPKRILKTDNSIPLFLISGDQDPVGGFGKDVTRLIQFYRNHGYQVESKLYPNLRHEILNEPCKETIMEDILAFLNPLVK